MKHTPVDFEITDVLFEVTRHGNIKPTIIFTAGQLEMPMELPNLGELLLSGFMIGDIMTASSLRGMNKEVTYRQGEDRSPPVLPTHCPCCGEELTVAEGRHTVIKCLNTTGCSAQIK